MRYAIIGTGALGGLYGGMLARRGYEVHFLLNRDYEHVRRHGLNIESHLGDFHLPEVHAHASSETMPPCDVTLVGLKTTRNAMLPDLIAAPTREGGVVLVLQNGLEVEREAEQTVGAARVLGGCCFLCSNKVGPGHIKHLDYGRIVFGMYEPNDRAREIAGRIAEEMRDAGIDVQLTDNLLLARWRKLLWNIPFNGLSVVLDASTKELVENPDSLALARSIMEEVRDAATSYELEIKSSMIEKTIEATRAMVPYDSSMRLDFLHKRPMEVEAIFGNPLRAGQTRGVEMPRVEMLYRQLKFIDAASAEPAESGVAPQNG